MLTDIQIAAVRTACFGDPTAAALIAAGNANGLLEHLNTETTFIVWRPVVDVEEIGRVVSYVAVVNLTATNLSRVTNFLALNRESFDPSRSDIRQYFADAFSGALGGQGQNTRDALEAMYRRAALRVEAMLATGTGSTASPGILSYEGTLAPYEATAIVFHDDGTIWTP
ncbi:MAG: hypothetical protein HYZ20_19625 [Burkholderiales bacterium]|nr:hypothetical protein [Burkholderiales bacterium]